MKKSLKIFLLLALITVMTCCFASCNKGESAYEIAKRNGFSGTEKQWLESLKGEKGEKGDQGTDGLNGADGKDGQNFNIGYTATDLFNEAVRNGYSGTFEEFIKEYFGSENRNNLTSVINRGLLTSCNIICPYTVTSGTTEKPITKNYFSGGSGVFYRVNKQTGDAFIITNYHVVYREGSTKQNHINEVINVHLYGDTYFSTGLLAEYIGGSATYDIAVIKITANEHLKNSYAMEAVFADSNELGIGDTVLAIGNPGSDGSSVTKGVVNVPSETIFNYDILGNETQQRVIRHDAVVNPGNSGGGLFNAKGELVGIVNAKLVKENYEGTGYAIPSNIVKGVVDNIIDNCYGASDGNEQVQKVTLGVTVKASSSKAVYDEVNDKLTVEETIVVDSVNVGSLASLYFKKGDVINSVTYAGKTYKVDRLHIISDLLLTLRYGHQITFDITRSGIKMKLNLVIDKQGYIVSVV